MTWPAVTLDELLTPVSRATTIEPTRLYRLLGVQWYAKGLFVREEKYGNEIQAKTLFEVHAGDFVYNRLFAWKGSFAVASPSDQGGFVSGEFPCFRVDTSNVEPGWLRWYFSLEKVWTEALGLSSGGTPTSRNRLKEERFLAMAVPLPPLPEQRRVVQRLDRVASRLGETREIRVASDRELRAALLIRFRQIVAEAPRRPLDNVAPIVRRPVEVDLEGEYPELGIRSFGKGSFHKAPLQGVDVGSKKLYWIHPRDLVFSNVFAWEGAVAVARADDVGRVGSHRFISCVPREGVAEPAFLLFYFLSPEGLDRLGSASPGGAGRNRTLGLDALAKIDVPVPSIDVQRSFADLAVRAEEAQRLSGEISSLSALVATAHARRVLDADLKPS